VIPEIGLMIGAYIVTRMVQLALKRDPREHVIVIVCSLATTVITGLVVADLLTRGSAPFGDPTNSAAVWRR
jgi:hypothetical protein